MDTNTIHLIVNNPDDPAGMPLFNAFGAKWHILEESVANLLECGEYPATMTYGTHRGKKTETGTITLDWDGSVDFTSNQPKRDIRDRLADETPELG